MGVRRGLAAPLRRPRRGGGVPAATWQATARRRAAGSGVAWPAEYGGRGAGPAEHYVVQEELARARAPELVGRIGINLVGPTLLAHGTDEQKQRWLPTILAGRRAVVPAVQRARRRAATSPRCRPAPSAVDGGWVLERPEGVDVLRAVRRLGPAASPAPTPTSPKHKGISLFVVDMRAPGVDVRPLRADHRRVRVQRGVPRRRVRARRAASSAPSTTAGASPTRPCPTSGAPTRASSSSTPSCSRSCCGWRSSRGGSTTTAPRSGWPRPTSRCGCSSSTTGARCRGCEHGLPLGPEGSRAQAVLERDEQAPARHGHGRARPGAPLWRGAEGNPADGEWQRSWLYYQAASIFAGTNEIQRNIIGERVLGLPREPAPATA